MAWLTCDLDGTEKIHKYKPERSPCWRFEGIKVYDRWEGYTDPIELPSGTIEKIIGRPLTWEDDAVEI